MLCCQNCFNDKFLKTYINTKGSESTCSFCGNINICCIPPKELGEFFLSITNLYLPVESSITPEQIANDKSNYIWDKIHDDWNIFSENVKDKRDELFKCILSDQIAEGSFKLLDAPYEIASQFYEVEDEEAKKLEVDWNEFSEEMKSRNRFFPSIKIDLEQLKHLLQ